MRKNSVLLVLLLGMAASVAKADTYNLVTAGTLPGGTSYGTVTLTQVGSNVSVTLALSNSSVLIATGAGGGNSVFWEMNVSPITVTGITPGYTLADATGNVATTANNGIHADGTGNWDYAITCGGTCGPGGSAPIGGTASFTVDNVSISNFITNGNGFLFGADVCVTNGQTGCPGGTGDVVNGLPVSSAPEPSSLALLGTPALSFAFMAIRRKLPHWKQ